MWKGGQRRRVNRHWYRPEEQRCPACGAKLKRSHLLWRKEVAGLQGIEAVGRWAYRCVTEDCPASGEGSASSEAESLHLK